MCSRRKGAKKKGSLISGEIQLQFAIADPAYPSATSQEILHKFNAIVAHSNGDDGDVDEDITKLDSNETDGEEHDQSLDTSDETDDATKPEAVEKRKRKLRLRRLKKKTKARAYEFTGGSDVIGIAFLEIEKITDLPPERNGMENQWQTSFAVGLNRNSD